MNYSDISKNSYHRDPLQIGYIWQYTKGDLAALSATTLHVTSVIDQLKRRGHQVRILSFRRGLPQWSDDLINWNPIKPVNRPWYSRVFESSLRWIQSRLKLPYLNLFDSYRFSDACVEVFDNHDILYERFWMLASGGFMASKRLNVPIVYEVNGDIKEEYREQGHKLSSFQWTAIRQITRYMFENSAQVVTVSEALKMKTVQGWRMRTNNVRAIENGARMDLFARTNRDESKSIRSRYGLNGEILIIFVGTFKPWHGLDLLVEAFDPIATSNPNIKLILVGDGPLRTDVEAQITGLHLEDKVIITGLVEHKEVPALLGAADIAVLNPRVSGASAVQSPLKLFEYMAAGKAIVAPMTPNFKRILIDRESGLLIPPDNKEALTDALLELLQDKGLRTKLGMAAQREAADKYSWDRTAAKLEELFFKLRASNGSN